VKQVSALIIGFAVFAACAATPAAGEDFTAGKTPAQLFRSDCGACHRSPNGLARERGNVGGLTAFLREHYTTKAESAAALAAYVSGLASPGGAARTGRGDRRSRSGDDAPVTATAVPAETKPAESAGKRRAHDDGDAPRPPRGVGTAGSTNAAADPLTRLRSYLSSGLDSGSASAQAARTGAPKARKRRAGAEETSAGAPAAGAETKPRADAPAGTASEAPPQGDQR
jgi:hypothetical protein